MTDKYIKLINCSDYQELSGRAAALVADIVKKQPKARLGLPTGSTPIGMYKILGEMTLDFSL